MNFNLILTRVLGILTKPKSEWEKIKGESTSIKDLYLKFACIVFALPSLFILLAHLFSVGFGGFHFTLLLAIISYVFVIGGVYLSGVLINVIAPQFGGNKDFIESQKLAVYSLVPFALASFLFIFLAGGFSVYSWFWPVLVFGLPYAIYLAYVGLPTLKGISGDKLVPFTIIIGVVFYIVFYLVFMLSFKIYWEMAVGSAYRTSMRAMKEYQRNLGN
ncbi:MAG: YIP1 family protein [Thermodesulfovibrionales bacterium]|nr:YIP1 family protein [Thermodesulfovibrionales bacterium]